MFSVKKATGNIVKNLTSSELSAQHRRVPSQLKNIRAAMEDGVLVLRGAADTPARRILYVNSYGMARAWRLWKEGLYPGNHLWGCLELTQMGYEILIPEPAAGRGLRRRLKNDWHPARIAACRLKADDLVYCDHNVLLWTPFLKVLKTVKCKIVGLLFAR